MRLIGRSGLSRSPLEHFDALKAVWPELNGPPELGRAATVRQAEAKDLHKMSTA